MICGQIRIRGRRYDLTRGCWYFGNYTMPPRKRLYLTASISQIRATNKNGICSAMSHSGPHDPLFLALEMRSVIYCETSQYELESKGSVESAGRTFHGRDA